MPSSHLVLPGVLFVGEDDRSRIVAHTGAAAGWFVPRGILGWSNEVSLVARDALTEEVRRATKLVMPEEQIAPARMPLAYQAASKSPLVAVSSRLVPKLVESGILVHTVGVDRLTSSFYYLTEGGGEEPVRVEGDLVAAVAAMLGDRADNAAIERVLDGLVDRLLRALSRGRVTELTVELAGALPRAAADGTGAASLDLEGFEKALAGLVGASERYSAFAQEIASKLADTNERRVEVPLFVEARKLSQGPFELTVGERNVSLPTYEHWVMSSPMQEPAGVAGAVSVATTPSAAEQASAKAAAEKVAAEKAEAERKAAEAKVAAEKAEAEKRAAAKAEAERKAKAEAEKKAAEAKAAAAKAAAEKAAAEKAAAEKAAAEKAAAEKAEAERLAAEKLEAEKAAAEKAEAEKAAAEKAAAEKAEAEKAEAEKRAAAEKAEAEKKAAAEKAEAEKLEAEKKAAAEKADAAKKSAKAESSKKDGDKKKGDGAKKKAGEKAEAKSADTKPAKSDKDKVAAKTKAEEAKPAPIEKKSSSMTWVMLAVALAGGWAVWHFFLSK